MERWRQSILQATLWASLALASLAYVPGVWAALQSNLGWLIIVDTVAWGSILLLALWRTLPFRIRAIAFLIPWCLFALLLLWMLGPAGAGIIWLTAVPVLAALFFGYVGAVAGIAFLALTSLGYYLLLPWRILIEYLPGQETTYDAVSWLASAGSMLFIATLVSLALAELLRRLEDTVESLGHANQRLTGIMDEREALQETILQSQKHSALGTLAAGIAHDFNNLLVPILMASEQVRDGTARDSEARRHLDTVIRSAERARQLVRRILNYSRERPASEYHPVRLEPVLREVGGLLRSSAPASIEMRYRIDAPQATVMADPEELHQILMNLGTNACLAMPEGGCLTWHLYAADEDDGVRLDVCDTGQGIAADVLPRIFDPFFTTREPGNGTGLGLSIVQRLVTAMQGHMDVESDGESGTCFRLFLPAADAPLPPDHTGRVTTTTSTGEAQQNREVLIVDDEDLVRGTLAMTLRHLGHEVKEAASPESALRQLHEAPERFDLVLTDLAMPGMNGIELTRNIRRILPSLPILVLSGHFTETDRQALASLGIGTLLHKPFSRQELTRAVEQALEPPGVAPGR